MQVEFVFEGRRRRLYIGDFPDRSTNAAREQAKLIEREVDQGLVSEFPYAAQ